MATAVGWLLVRTSQSHGIHSTIPNPRWMTRNLLKVGHPTCMIPQVKHMDYPDQCVYLYIYKYMQFTPFSFTDNEKMYFSKFTFFTLTKSYTDENFEPCILKV